MLFLISFCKIPQDLNYSLLIFESNQDFTEVFGSSQDRLAVRAVSLRMRDPKLRLWVRVTECKLFSNWLHKELGDLKIWLLCLKFLVKHLFSVSYILPEKQNETELSAPFNATALIGLPDDVLKSWISPKKPSNLFKYANAGLHHETSFEDLIKLLCNKVYLKIY